MPPIFYSPRSRRQHGQEAEGEGPAKLATGLCKSVRVDPCDPSHERPPIRLLVIKVDISQHRAVLRDNPDVRANLSIDHLAGVAVPGWPRAASRK